MPERCCVCDENGENQCSNEATWHTWDMDKPYHETHNDYCDEHVVDGLVPDGWTGVCAAELL